MIDNPFREFLDKISSPLVHSYQRLGLAPNQLSIGGLLLAILAAVFTANGWIWWALIIWWLGRLLDGTDGIYARKTGQSSDLGAYLDILCDMAAYSIMVVGFYFLYPDLTVYWLVIIILYTLCITSTLTLGIIEEKRALTPRDNRGLRMGAGLAEAGETGISYSLFLLLPSIIQWLVWIWIAILTITIISRTWLAWRITR